VAVITIVLASGANVWYSHSIKEKTALNEDYTNQKFLRYLVVYSIYFMGGVLIILAFPSLRGVAQTALGGAGILAIITGLASQEALANIVSGIFIISFKPFKIGDIIRIDESKTGTVTDITLRHTIIRNYQNNMIVIPNSIINKEKIVNYDLGDRMYCQWIDIGVSYNSDIDLAKHIVREECESHPNIVDHRSELDIYNQVPKVTTRIIGLEDSAVVLRAWAWARNFDEAFSMKCDLFESIKKRFDKEGIEIPFPYRTLILKRE